MKKVHIFLVMGFLSIQVFGQNAAEIYQKAMTFKAKENFTETAKLMTQALELDPQNNLYKKELADAQYEKRAFFVAIPLYEQLLSEDENNINILVRLAEMYSMSPEKMKGLEYAERAVKQKPLEAHHAKLLARTYMEVKHYPKAIKLYQSALEASPNDLDIPFKIAKCYENISDHENASRYYLKTLELDPENPTKIYQAANSCYDANKYNKAVELYQTAEDKGYFKSKAFYENWAMSYEEMQDNKMALFYYTKAKNFEPFDKDLNISISNVYIKLTQFDKAREVLDEMLEINPNDGELMYQKGMTYYKAGNTGKAEQFFNRAFELDPSLKSLRYAKNNF